MQDTEYEALTDPEKHFMQTLNAKPFLFICEFRQKGPSMEDCLTWGLTASRFDTLAQAVGQHQTGAARLLALESQHAAGRAASLAATMRQTLMRRLTKAQAAAELAAKEIKAVTEILAKLP